MFINNYGEVQADVSRGLPTESQFDSASRQAEYLYVTPFPAPARRAVPFGRVCFPYVGCHCVNFVRGVLRLYLLYTTCLWTCLSISTFKLSPYEKLSLRRS